MALFSLDQKSRGRAAYVAYLEKRALVANGDVSDEAMRALRRGWYLGEDSFKDKLMNLLDDAAVKLTRNRSSVSGDATREHIAHEAEKIIQRVASAWSLEHAQEAMQELKKADERKVKIALILRQKTNEKNEWIAQRLAMGVLSQ